jgi:hypothetical protein
VRAHARLRRTLSVAALAVVAITTLSGCHNKVGMAASVDGHRLTDTDLATYFKKGSVPYTDQNTHAQVVPKVYALENWIEGKVFEAAVAHKGGAVTSAELNTARAAVLGSRTIAQAETFYRKLGYTPKFAHLIVDQTAVLVVLVQRIARGISPQQAIGALQSNQAGTELLKAISAAKPKVAVSPRYGTWDNAKLTLTSTPGVGAPGFVRFGTGSAAITP